MRKAIIFSAPSGAGKTTIIRRLIEMGLPLGFSISATSRSPRAGETNGIDYFFFTTEEFKQKIEQNEFIEWEEVYEEQYYGTLKSEIERVWDSKKAVVFDVDVKGGINLKNLFKDIALSVFVQPPSVEVLENRLRLRQTESEESIAKRLERAKFELSFAKKFDVVIINDDLETATNNAFKTINSFLNKL